MAYRTVGAKMLKKVINCSEKGYVIVQFWIIWKYFTIIESRAGSSVGIGLLKLSEEIVDLIEEVMLSEVKSDHF